MTSNGCALERAHKDAPKVVDGTIDLSGWNFQRDGSIDLYGDWLFKWDDLVEPAVWPELREQFRTTISIPAGWHTQERSDENSAYYRGMGFGTYLLRIDGLASPSALNISFYGIPGAARLTVFESSGLILGQSSQGVVSKTARDEVPVVYKESGVRISPEANVLKSDDSLFLLLEVSVHHYPRGGVWAVPRLELESDWRSRMGFELFSLQVFFGALVLVGFYHLILFGLRSTDVSLLYFALFTLSVAIRPLVMGIAQRSLGWSESISDFVTLMRLELLTVPFICITFGLFIESVVRSNHFAIILKYLVAIPGTILGLLTCLTLPSSFIEFLIVYQIYALISVFLTIFHLVVQVRRGARLAAWCLGALGFTALGLVNDILHVLLVIETTFIGHYTVMAFILLQAGILAARNADAHQQVELLSQNLQDEVNLQTVELQKKTEAALSAREESEKLKEQALADAQKLRELDRQKTAFFQNISHELRTPLTLMLHPLDAAMRELGQNENISVARKNCSRLLRLVNQLLDFQKLSTQSKSLRLRPLDMVSFLRVASDHFSSSSSHRDIRFTTTVNGLPLSSDLPRISGLADLDSLEKVVFNFLSNALKFSPAGSCIELGLTEANGRLQIFVRDQGPGISKEDHPKLFQIFTQLDDSSTREHEGSGLGLALCKTLAEEMKGSVGVESELGLGAKFWLELEATEEAGSEVDQEFQPKDWLNDWSRDAELPEIDSTLNGTGQHILVVDDLADMRMMVGKILMESGYRVSFASDGMAAVEFIERELPELIITDWMMPRMDGVELVRWLRESDGSAGLPIIMLTAKSDHTSRLEGLDQGADAFLGKPFSELEVVTMVQNLLNLKSSEKSLKSYTLQLEEALDALKVAELQRVESARQSTLSRLASGLAHELRNPLNVIQGIAETVDDGLEREEISAISRLLNQACERADGVVRRLVKLADTSHSDEFSRVSDALERVHAILDVELEQHEISLVTSGDLGLDVAMGCSELSQVLVQLIHNAIEATGGAGEITISCRATASGVELLVSDWGAGVAVDLAERIFEPFFTTRLERNASGLGLTISRRFLQARGGALKLRQASKPTIFVVEMKATQT